MHLGVIFSFWLALLIFRDMATARVSTIKVSTTVFPTTEVSTANNNTKGCPSGLWGIPGSTKCFKRITKKVSWSRAKEMCIEEGLLLATPSDRIAVALWKYLLDQARKLSWWEAGGSRYGIPGCCENHWVNARGSGWQQVWQQSDNPVNTQLAKPWLHEYVTEDYCLEIAVSEHYWNIHPGRPYGTIKCSLSNGAYPLCEGERIRYSGWSAWSRCSKTCGSGGTQRRSRQCISRGCQASDNEKETQNCSGPPCPVDGGWSPWSEFSLCSTTCGLGEQRRTRTCTSPVPHFGGRDCNGAMSDTRYCNMIDCAIDEDKKWCIYIPFNECAKYKTLCPQKCSQKQDEYWCPHIPLSACITFKTQCPIKCIDEQDEEWCPYISLSDCIIFGSQCPITCSNNTSTTAVATTETSDTTSLTTTEVPSS